MHVSFVSHSVPHFPFVLPPVFSHSFCTVIELSLLNGTKSATPDANVSFWVGKLVFTQPVSRPDYVRCFRPGLQNIVFMLRHNLAEHQCIRDGQRTAHGMMKRLLHNFFLP